MCNVWRSCVCECLCACERGVPFLCLASLRCVGGGFFLYRCFASRRRAIAQQTNITVPPTTLKHDETKEGPRDEYITRMTAVI